MSRITVRVDGRAHQVPLGTTVAEVLGRVAIDDRRIVAAALDNHVVGLSAAIDGDAEVRPITTGDPLGTGVVRRTVAHVLHAAARQLDPALQLVVGQSLLGGYFYEVAGPERSADALRALAGALTGAIEGLAAAHLPFEARRVPVEATDAALSDPAGTKARLLRAWAAPMVPIVGLEGFVDIQHGPYAPDTGVAQGARVVAYPPGLVLQFPGAPELEHVERRERRLFSTYRETRDWNRRLGVASVADLNHEVLADRAGDVVRVAEALHEKKAAEIADEIAARPGVRVVCLAGPSSSGKTTFVRRLSVQLRVSGLEPRVLSLDDYYRDRVDCPRDADGEYDFEALEALDLELLSAQLAALVTGEEVRTPRFDFVRGRPLEREAWAPLQLAPGQVLLLEGIHGLNPRLTAAIPAAARFRVYVNALTQLVIDEHNRIYTADTRLLRRIVRDRRYRGTPAAETIARWPSVRRGEREHIFPYEEEADAVFNSALVYEVAVLKTFAVRFLLEVPREHPSRAEAYRLLKFLDLFVPLFPDDVPATSVLREFMGGSGFAG